MFSLFRGKGKQEMNKKVDDQLRTLRASGLQNKMAMNQLRESVIKGTLKKVEPKK